MSAILDRTRTLPHSGVPKEREPHGNTMILILDNDSQAFVPQAWGEMYDDYSLDPIIFIIIYYFSYYICLLILGSIIIS